MHTKATQISSTYHRDELPTTLLGDSKGESLIMSPYPVNPAVAVAITLRFTSGAKGNCFLVT